MSSERERLAMLEGIFAEQGAGIAIGLGDDAAVLDAGEGSWVWSLDAAIEHVHFCRAWLSFEQLGYRATMAALSDLAAMGATPRGVLSSLVVPDDVDDEALRQLACGQRRAAGEVETSVCGGNLSRGTELAIHTTVLGVAEQPLRRDAARASDGVFVVGTPGLAAAGLEVARAGAASADVGEAMRTALEAWRQPRALIAHGVKAAGCAHAAIDLSDGLVLDASRVAEASRVAVVFDAAAVVSEPLAGVASKLGLEALELALYGGEDYALLLMGPVAAALSGWRRIGHCAPPDQLEPGVYLERGGETVPLPVRGFDHFAAESTAE